MQLKNAWCQCSSQAHRRQLPPSTAPRQGSGPPVCLTLAADGARGARQAGRRAKQLVICALPALLLGGGARGALESRVAGRALLGLQACRRAKWRVRLGKGALRAGAAVGVHESQALAAAGGARRKGDAQAAAAGRNAQPVGRGAARRRDKGARALVDAAGMGRAGQAAGASDAGPGRLRGWQRGWLQRPQSAHTSSLPSALPLNTMSQR